MDMDYALILEKAKFMFIFIYVLGLYTSWLLGVLDRFSLFVYKVIRKYMRLKKIKKLKERRSLDARR